MEPNVTLHIERLSTHIQIHIEHRGGEAKDSSGRLIGVEISKFRGIFAHMGALARTHFWKHWKPKGHAKG